MPLDTYDRLGYFTSSGANLSNTNLKDADLEGLILINADFSSANLQNTNLVKTNLTGANFDKASLVNTKLTNANLKNASLSTLITSNNDLSNVNLTGADLSEAMLSTDLDGFADIKSCPGKMPPGWYCENNTFKTIGDIQFSSITQNALPVSMYCPSKEKYLKFKENKKEEKFVVGYTKGKKFHNGGDFEEALEVLEETYNDQCV